MRVLMAAVLAAALARPGGAEEGEVALSLAARKAGVQAVEKAVGWLKTQQNQDGSIGKASLKMKMPAFTGLALLGLLGHGLTEKDPVVKKGVEYLLGFVKPDGGIHGGFIVGQNTGISIMVLQATGNPKYKDTIAKGRKFLMDLQVDTGEKKSATHPEFGGIGYDSKNHADLQNLWFALEALRATADTAEVPTGATDEDKMNVWDKALLFLKRCQNLKSSNDQAWSGDDGGFLYSSTPESKAGGTKSYGTMTYAGLLSLIYCQVDRDDPRVQAAWKWIQEHYSLNENPGMGADGLFYAYHTFAKVLQAYGQEVVRDAKGVSHVWRREYMEKLAGLQDKDGWWANRASERWMENDPVLVTSYCVIGLQRALAGTER